MSLSSGDDDQDTLSFPLAQLSAALTATPGDAGHQRQAAVSSNDGGGSVLTATSGVAGDGPSATQASSSPSITFAWTPRAAEALLRVRFGAMRDRFHRNKSSKQLAIAWELVAAETSRIGGVIVDSKQCKSKIKHMHKQYTAYRVAEAATGNQTDKPLREPPCYSTMCDVWDDREGMNADAFFSSDASDRSLPGSSREQLQESVNADDESDGGAVQRAVQGSSRGWKSRTGKRSRRSDDTVEGMISIGEGLNNIAEAFKVARVQSGETQGSDVASSMRELTETVRSQAQSNHEMMSSV